MTAAENEADDELETATFAGGCFWCLEAVFDQVNGVRSVESGYMGGHTADPSYEEVCSGATGHAEAVRIRFDPREVSYRELLQVFFAIHDPTTPDRQGNDIGTQYRSAVFHHSEAQKATAAEVIAQLDKTGLWKARIVTELVPAGVFYAAEPYHQEYFERNPSQPYCQFVVEPKLAKFRRQFLDKLKK